MERIKKDTEYLYVQDCDRIISRIITDNIHHNSQNTETEERNTEIH